MKEIRAFKARPSSIAHIMAGSAGITDIQAKKIEELEAKALTEKGLTLKQLEQLAILVNKRDHPPIPEGLKTYCKSWLKKELLGKKGVPMSSKYTEKGTVQEDVGIELAAEVLGEDFLIKNEEKFFNAFVEGTPDLILSKDEVWDIKCSWDEETFPLFETNIPNMLYWWQLQCYMWMLGSKRAKLVYCLVDTPENIIEAQVRKEAFKLGYEEIDEDFYSEVRDRMIFSDSDPKLRVKTFEFDRDDEAIALIQKRVEMCREYIINELLPMVA
jgi:hypothetical protein